MPLEMTLKHLSILQMQDGETLFEALYQSAWNSLDADARSIAHSLSLLKVASWQEMLDSTRLSAERLNQALQSLNDASLPIIDGEQST
jgi:hypothetical protein